MPRMKKEDSELLIVLSARLRQARKECGLERQDVQKLLKITSSSTISYHEDGKRFPEYDLLKSYATLYNCTIDWLFGMSERKEFTRRESELLSYNELELITLYRKASESDKNVAKRVLESSIPDIEKKIPG